MRVLHKNAANPSEVQPFEVQLLNHPATKTLNQRKEYVIFNKDFLFSLVWA